MRPPAFWAAGLDPKSREAAPLTRALLTPLAYLYTVIQRRKRARTRPAKVGAFVICVGNLTLGGAGKTPIVKALRDWMMAETGLTVATLSRGYGGRLKGPLEVIATHHSAADVGDEPLMLAQTGIAWIGRDRADAARQMAVAGIEVILMDDGHQNPALIKDISLVVIDRALPFGNGHVFPKGPLREPITEGLTRADGILLLGQDGPVPTEVSKSGKPVLCAHLEPARPLPAGPLVAFAGIGRPLKFFDMLAARGATLCETVPFNDHHPYTAHDFAYLEALARDHGAQLVTTEKDHIRLTTSQRARVLPIPAHILWADETALAQLLTPVLKAP